MRHRRVGHEPPLSQRWSRVYIPVYSRIVDMYLPHQAHPAQHGEQCLLPFKYARLQQPAPADAVNGLGVLKAPRHYDLEEANVCAPAGRGG